MASKPILNIVANIDNNFRLLPKKIRLFQVIFLCGCSESTNVGPLASREIAKNINELPFEILANHIFKFFSLTAWLENMILVCQHWFQVALKANVPKQLVVNFNRKDHRSICNGILARFKVDTLLLPYSSDSMFLFKSAVNASPRLHTLAIGTIPYGNMDGFKFTENKITLNDEEAPPPAIRFPQITTLSLPAQRLSFLQLLPNVKNLKLSGIRDSLDDFQNVTQTYPSVKELEFFIKNSPNIDFGMLKRIFPSLKKAYILYKAKVDVIQEHWNQLEVLGQSIGIEVLCRFNHVEKQIFDFSSISYAHYAIAYEKSPLSFFVQKGMVEKVNKLLKTHTTREYEQDLRKRSVSFQFPYLSPSVSFNHVQKFGKDNALSNEMNTLLYNHGLLSFWRTFISYVNSPAYVLAVDHLKEAHKYPKIKGDVLPKFLRLLKNVKAEHVLESIGGETAKTLFATTDSHGETLLHDYARDDTVIDLSPFKDVIDWNAVCNKKWNAATLAFDRNHWLPWMNLVENGCEIQADLYQPQDYTRLIKNFVLAKNDYTPLDIIHNAKKSVIFGVADCLVSSDPPRNTDLLDLVIEKYGEDPNSCDDSGTSVFNKMLATGDIEKHASILEHMLNKYKIDINHVDKAGNTPLTKAIKTANAARILFALEHGANPNIAANTLLPLHLLCSVDRDIISEGLEPLLAHGANINEVDYDEFGRKITPLSVAIVTGQTIDEIKFLILKGADPLFVDEAGNTMLHTLLLTEKIATITRLVEPLSKLVDTNKPNKLNETPLHRALLSGYATTIIDPLIKGGANINQPGGLLNQSCLMMVLQHSLPSLKPLLREGTMDLKIRDKLGRSFVHYFFQAHMEELRAKCEGKFV
jgi:ankyrin repeat protein